MIEKDFALSLSIVIPVYNKESSLEFCIQSLEKQSLSHSEFEAILVDDGSTDKSLKLCHELQRKYQFVKVLHQENGGVSSARNAGMAQAHGRYIMFLDADDYIAPSTAKSIVECFDRIADQVDVVTYPLRYLSPQTGVKRSHRREEWLKEEGVYSLEDHPFIAQTTMNVCVKNKGKDGIRFDPDLKMGEDQLFILKNLAAKAAIGYAPKAEYVYIKDGSNSSRVGNNPLYAYNDMMKLYCEYLEIGSGDSRLREYVYQTILYNIDWRLRSDLLFPTYCEGEERKREEGRLAAVMDAIPSRSYCNSPYLSEYHKAFLFKRYGLSGSAPAIEYDGIITRLTLADGEVWETNSPKILLSRALEKRDKIFFSGRIMGPTLLFEQEPSLWLCSDDGKVELSLGACSYDYCQAKVKTAKGYGISFDLSLVSGKMKNVRFVLDIPGRGCISVSVEDALRRHNAYVSNSKTTLMFRHYKVSLVEDMLKVSRRSAMGSFAMLMDRVRYKRSAIAKRIAVKIYQFRKRGKEIWLYADLPTSPNEGNALTQFIHDAKLDDGVERYYVTNFEDELVKKHTGLKGRTLACESREHVCCALTAKVVLASYLESFTFRPVSQNTFDGLGDLVGDQELIYLQHGILHAHMPWYFSYDRILFDKIVVSTQFEIENLTKNYCFPEEALIPFGMPRFDQLDASPKRHLNKIAFIPSWRGYLVAGKASERIELDDAFLKSKYFRETAKFIMLLQDSKVLEDCGYTMDLKLHPNFQCYAKLFELKEGAISLASSSFDEGDYSIVVTDFSSYVYDFVYLGCKVMYFVPDYREYQAGLNQYSKLDLPFEEGFGPLCITAEEAVSKLSMLIGRDSCSDFDCIGENKFFLRREEDSCKRLYLHCRKAHVSNEDSITF